MARGRYIAHGASNSMINGFEIYKLNINSLNALYTKWDAKEALKTHGSLQNKSDIDAILGVGREFQDQAAHIFSQIPVIWMNEEKTIVDTYKTITQECEVLFRGHIYTTEEIRDLLAFFRDINFSEYVVGTATKLPSKFNAAVPIFLYGHKMFNNIPYSAWDRSDPWAVHTITPKTFRGLEGLICPDPSDFELSIHEIREQIIGTSGLLTHKIKASKDEGFNSLHQVFKKMLCQLWIWNSQVRNEHMIMDWNNWSNTPEPIDSAPKYLTYATRVY